MCEPNWLGDGCEVYACRGDCSGQGRCIRGECACHDGFGGLECQYDARCPNFCNARGTCDGAAAESGTGGACVCRDGWGGVDCSIPPRRPDAEDQDDDHALTIEEAVGRSARRLPWRDATLVPRGAPR